MPKVRDRYARVPGRLWRDPALAALSSGAWGLFLKSWSYFADAMSDGVVPAAAVRQIGDPQRWKRDLAELVGAGIWEEVEGGYRDTWYLRDETNITRAAWEGRKAETKKRVTDHRKTKRKRKSTKPVTRYPQTQDAGLRTDDAGPRSERGARAPDVPELDLEKELLDGFARRWETAVGEGRWPRTASDGTAQAVLVAVLERDDPEDAIERGLDGYFAHCADHSVRPEFGWALARDFGKWIARTSLPAGSGSHPARVEALRRLAAESDEVLG